MSFNLYKSSAGSGKTYTLVKEYLKLVLKSPSKFKNILAITFTNDAAGEMKLRIIEKLKEFSKGEKSSLSGDILNELKIDEQKLKINSKKVLNSILHSYSDFAVMTIDSFVYKIIKTFSVDLDIPLNFDVDMDISNLTQKIIDNLIDKAGENNYIGEMLTNYALSKINSKNSWNIDSELFKMGKESFREKNIDNLRFLLNEEFDNKFWKKLIEYVREQINSYRKHINSLAQNGVDIIEKSDITYKDFSYKKRGNGYRFYKLSKANTPDELDIGSRFRKSDKWIAKKVKKKKPHKYKKLQKVVQELEILRENIVNFVDKNEKKFLSHFLILKNIYSQAILHKFEEEVQKYKRENNIIPISDFGKKVERLINKEIIPFIYSRIGSKYDNYLIDEFQDTSRLQWENLFPLIEDSLAVNNFNMGVGDGKQAIYRWRAGDLEIMESEVPELFKNRLKIKKLNSNYRSKATIVNFNNKFFSNINEYFDTSDSLFEKLYNEENVKQNIINKEKGYVQIKKLNLDDMNKPQKDAQIIKNLVNDIKNIIKKDNNYSPEDIAILVRKNKEGSLITEELFQEGIDVVSSDSLLLKNSKVIRFIISVLKYISRKEDIALLNIYYFYNKKIKDDSLFEDSLDLSKYDRDSLKEELPDRFINNIRHLSQKPIYEIVEEVINIFNLFKYYGGFLQGFLDVLFEYSLKNRGDITSFLNWWEDNKDSNKCSHVIPETKNAVTVSTVHKAKGLEFPVVFIPFEWKLSESSGSNVDSIWVNYDIFENGSTFPFLIDLTKDAKKSCFKDYYLREKEKSIIDNINLLYVAFTRPKSRLYIYTKNSNSGRLKNTYHLINKVIKEKNIQFECEDNIYYLGKKLSKSKKEQIEMEKSISNVNSSHWRNKITIRRRAKNLWKLDKTAINEKIDWGILLHSTLERIEYAEDLDDAVREMVREGYISSSKKEEMKNKLLEIFEIKEKDVKVKDWFEKKYRIINEKNILTEKEEYRPDRLVFGEGAVKIIDYKTGKIRKKDVKQIEKYSDLLLKMGYNNIEKYLLYIEKKKIIQL
ncbi:MAG: hypothetical protein FXF47_09700 [Candidatus Mcinerneyibacterium aminivorans]|uniref:DNA 3'-5' helicase n=1 Tax=Candidatus Mcinerneyibacterium aminivorans TaxID=2703815 RepID=A0A5D0MFZ5_9BACT|nr:MAG: hypothetical protein FXF47_09700 [Candidatus Mcinerneyibacterium aminivorans]